MCSSDLPGLAALLGHVAPCGACVVRVRRACLALSVRQDPAGQPAETDLLDDPYLNTAHNHYEYGSNRFSLVEQAPGATTVESVVLKADTVSEVTGPLA